MKQRTPDEMVASFMDDIRSDLDDLRKGAEFDSTLHVDAEIICDVLCHDDAGMDDCAVLVGDAAEQLERDVDAAAEVLRAAVAAFGASLDASFERMRRLLAPIRDGLREAERRIGVAETKRQIAAEREARAAREEEERRAMETEREALARIAAEEARNAAAGTMARLRKLEIWE